MSHTILVADDDDEIRRYVTSLLEREGYVVWVASHGRQALGMIRTANGEVDLILTDVEMPELSGLDLQREAQQLRPPVPVVLMTGAVESLGDQLDGRPVLPKPFLPQTLISLVRSLLGSS